MASLYSSSVTASQVGSYFVEQYYSMLQQQPEFAYQFYTDSSSMIRVDGESTQTASAIYHIHTLLQSLHFSGIEIGTINSSESWSGGILVVVSGAVKSNCFLGSRKFVQTFFLAPQEKGYFVINDIFHFVSDEVTNHFSPLLATVHKHDFQPLSSSQNLSVVEDAFEVEKFNSVHLQSNGQGDYFTSQDRQNQQQEDYEEESTVKQPSFNHVDHFQESFYQNTVKFDQQPLHQNTSLYVQESTQAVEKPVRFTYASILKSNAKSTSSVTSVPTQAPVIKRIPSTTGLHQPPEPDTTPHVTEDASVNEEGESMSVYVRNLPTSITTQEILQEFKNFGRIKQDGVFIKNRKDVGVCFAFVEFEDLSGVYKAIEASPIQLAGKQVYVEERRANSSSSSSSRGGKVRGGGKGRGSNDATRGRYGDASNGRGNGLRNY